MHSFELEKKLRLPDPAKTVEAIWRLLRARRQKLSVATATSSVVFPSVDELVSRKSGKLRAEERKAQGTQYYAWTARVR